MPGPPDGCTGSRNGAPMRERNTIVVGYDGSKNARDALEEAAGLIADGGTVHVVTAYRPPSAGETARMWNQLPEEFRLTWDPLAEPQAREAEALALLEERGVDGAGHLVDDDPASAILDVADETDADLVVVGSRGLGRARRVLRGSVSSKVASHAKASLLVVRAHD